MATAATIIAIILGPILAVQAQKLIERIKQKHEEKRRLFMSLMVTRGQPLAPEHVQALNMIDIVFSAKKDKIVVEAWSELRDHLYNYPQAPVQSGSGTSDADSVAHRNQLHTWGLKKDDLLIELLARMAESLNFHFDKVLLKRGAYTPSRYEEDQAQQYVIRRGLTEVFLGLKSIPIHIVEPKNAGQASPPQEGASEISRQSVDEKDP